MCDILGQRANARFVPAVEAHLRGSDARETKSSLVSRRDGMWPAKTNVDVLGARRLPLAIPVDLPSGALGYVSVLEIVADFGRVPPGGVAQASASGRL